VVAVLRLPVDCVWAVSVSKCGRHGGRGWILFGNPAVRTLCCGEELVFGPPCGLCKLVVLSRVLNLRRVARGGGACAAASRLALLN
jgi:hypothetical protein